MRINRGRGRKAKEATELKMLAMSSSKPTRPPQNKSAPIKHVSMKAKAMGMPVAINTTRLPKISRSAKGHSNDAHLRV